MSWDDGISGPHRDVAASEHPKIGFLAGPGTGKTSLGLMRRVLRLLESGTPGKRILLLSFTRVAAADLRDKVAALEGPGVEDVRATTLHGYCFGLLQRESVLLVTGRVPRVLLDHEVDLLLRDIGGDFGTIYDRRHRLEAFVAGWARGVEDYPGVANDTEDRQFEQAVMMWLREHKAMLIGEVVPLTYNFLKSNPVAEEMTAFDHVIVDEYQDLNVLEQSLLDLLAQHANLCVAGDDDQSIYSVRYANPSGILEFLDRDDVEAHSILVCGRCPRPILSMANSLIAQAPGRNKQPLVTREDSIPGFAAIVQWPNIEAEVDGIVSAVASDVGSGQRDPGELLVLTNWRKIGEQIRARLTEVGIPVRSFFTEEEVKSEFGRASLALLRLVVNDEDAPALRVLLGLGDNEGRTAAYQRLLTYCRQQSTTARAALERLRNGERLGISVQALVQGFSTATSRAAQLREMSVPDLVDALFPDGEEATADLRAIAVDHLGETPTAEELLRVVVEAITQDTVPQSPDFVRVMSLHKSKGLTSRSVYVVGAVQGVLPTLVSDNVGQRELAVREGRRLFYVAVTRASEELVISSSTTMDLADANARRVVYDRRRIRRSGNRYVVRTIACQYLQELGRSAPRPVAGAAWLASR